MAGHGLHVLSCKLNIGVPDHVRKRRETMSGDCKRRRAAPRRSAPSSANEMQAEGNLPRIACGRNAEAPAPGGKFARAHEDVARRFHTCPHTLNDDVGLVDMRGTEGPSGCQHDVARVEKLGQFATQHLACIGGACSLGLGGLVTGRQTGPATADSGRAATPALWPASPESATGCRPSVRPLPSFAMVIGSMAIPCAAIASTRASNSVRVIRSQCDRRCSGIRSRSGWVEASGKISARMPSVAITSSIDRQMTPSVSSAGA